jgi:hypothetical protein
VRTTLVDGDAEETPFCAFCLVLEAHAREIDVALRRRDVGVPRARLQRCWRPKSGLGVSAGRRGATVSRSAQGRKQMSLGWRGLFWRKRV